MATRFLGYDKNTLRLDVEVTGAHRYEFYDIPHSLYEEMLASQDQAEYFNSHIWNRFEHKTYWRDLEQLFDYLREDLFFFASHVTVDTQQADGDTPLHVACVWGDVRAVELLLEGGANPNTPGDLSCTPLYNAVCFGHVRCAELLLRAGALPDAANELNTTPKRKALESGNPRMVALFSPAV